jgi:hypothetical protein
MLIESMFCLVEGPDSAGTGRGGPEEETGSHG